MIKVDVLIVVEHVSRELESACLLKLEFMKRGYKTVIVGIYPNKEQLALQYSADIIIVPWIYTGTKYVYSFLKYSPNVLLVNLHQEQYGVAEDKSLIPYGEAQKVCHISWGKVFTQQLIDAGCDKDCILTVGSIRLDLFKHPFSLLFDKRKELAEEFGMDSDKKWVLIIGDSSHLVEDYLFKGLKEGEYDPRPMFKIGTECRTSMLNYIDQYLENNSDTVFIYRPHPSYANKDISRDDIKYLCTKYPKNFYALFKYALNTWVISSDICISYISTSIIECYFARTPYYLFRTSELDQRFDIPFLHNYQYKIKNYKSFDNYLRNKEFDFNEMAKTLKDYYSLDNSYSYVQTVDGILSFDRKKEKPVLSKKVWRQNLVRSVVKSIVSFIAKNRVIKKALVKNGDNRIYRIIADENDIVTPEKVEYYEKAFSNCLNGGNK